MWRKCPFVTQHQRLKHLRILMKFGAGNLYKTFGNYEFVKTVSVEVIFYLRAYKSCLSVISVFIKRFG